MDKTLAVYYSAMFSKTSLILLHCLLLMGVRLPQIALFFFNARVKGIMVTLKVPKIGKHMTKMKSLVTYRNTLTRL